MAFIFPVGDRLSGRGSALDFCRFLTDVLTLTLPQSHLLVIDRAPELPVGYSGFVTAVALRGELLLDAEVGGREFTADNA